MVWKGMALSLEMDTLSKDAAAESTSSVTAGGPKVSVIANLTSLRTSLRRLLSVVTLIVSVDLATWLLVINLKMKREVWI